MTTVKDIYDQLNRDYPFSEQEPWDNSGLLCGNEKNEVKTCLVTLDVTADAIRKAKELQAELIISHHPIIFSPQKSFTAGNPAYEAAANGIAVISAHTNFDKAPTGTGKILSDILGIKTQYDDNALFRTGCLDREQTVKQTAMHISEKLNTAVSYNFGDRIVKKIAICTGAGGSEIAAVAASGAELYITGEMKYHEFADASAMGLAVITAGHFETEDPAMEILAKRLNEQFPDVCFIKHQSEPPFITSAR